MSLLEIYTASSLCLCVAFDLPHLRSHNAMQGLELVSAQASHRRSEPSPLPCAQAGEGSLPWHDQVKERMSIDTEPFVRFAGISTLFNSAAEGSGQEFVAALEPLTKHDSNLVSWKASETIYMLEKGLTRSCL